MNIREWKVSDDRVLYNKLRTGAMFMYYNKIYMKLNLCNSVDIVTGHYRFFMSRLSYKVRRVELLMMVN